MAYKYSFADNETYGAEDMNKMVGRLVSGGVSDPFSDGTPYNLSSFNSAGALLYTSGAVPETVNTLKVSPAQEGKVLINPGTAYFNDGSLIDITAGGHSLSFTAGVKNYVYLKNDLASSNTSYPVCSPTAPTGDFVPLAEISEAGEITDVRTYAKGKVPGYASSALYTMKIADTVAVTDGQPENKTYQLGNNSYRYLMAIQDDSVVGTNTYCCLGVYSFSDGTILSFYGNELSSRGRSDEELYLYRNNNHLGTATVTVAGSVLTLHTSYFNEASIDLGSFPITLYLF